MILFWELNVRKKFDILYLKKLTKSGERETRRERWKQKQETNWYDTIMLVSNNYATSSIIESFDVRDKIMQLLQNPFDYSDSFVHVYFNESKKNIIIKLHKIISHVKFSQS